MTRRPGSAGVGDELPFREVTGRVREHLARGQTKEAVEWAREAHARLKTAASEDLAVEAYLARIEGLAARGLTAEARALATSVSKRFPTARARLAEGSAPRALAELVRPLADLAIGAEERARLEGRVLREVTDLSALADVASLPEGHALRRAAAALARAFVAVTSRPVGDEELLLPEVPRRSPLAPWKHLLRAIACYHRGDDGRCAEALSAIPADAAAARLVPPLRELLAGRAVAGFGPGGQQELVAALKGLDAAFAGAGSGAHAGRPQGKCLRAIEAAVAVCAREAPDLLARLRQLVSTRGLIIGLERERLRRVMGGPARRDVEFWRLLSRAFEVMGDLPAAAAGWHELVRVAVLTGRFEATGLEAAAIHQHVAALLRLELEQRGDARLVVFRREFKGFGEHYRGQTPEVAAWAPPDGRPDLWYLDPDRLYERACRLDPHREAFEAWWSHAARRGEVDKKAAERVAAAWHAALPADPAPLLHLASAAEARGALALALKHVDQAQRLDALDPTVRRARFRLLVAAARRHARQKKPHLLRSDLEALERLAEAREGQRPALLAALRWVGAQLRGDGPEAARWHDETRERLASALGAGALLQCVGRACGVTVKEPAGGAAETLVEGLGRAAQAAADGAFSLEVSDALARRLETALKGPAVVATTCELRALTEGLLTVKRRSLAHAVAGEGLRRGGPTAGRFLLLRARSLPDFSHARRRDACAAAAELGRRQRDLGLVREAIELSRVSARYGEQPEEAPTAEALERILERERTERSYPRRPAAEDVTRGGCDCATCRGARSYEADPDLYGDDGEVDEVEALWGAGGPALPPELASVLDELLRRAERDGGLPDPDELARRDPALLERFGAVLEQLSSSSPRRGGRRRRGR